MAIYETEAKSLVSAAAFFLTDLLYHVCGLSCKGLQHVLVLVIYPLNRCASTVEFGNFPPGRGKSVKSGRHAGHPLLLLPQLFKLQIHLLSISSTCSCLLIPVTTTMVSPSVSPLDCRTDTAMDLML